MNQSRNICAQTRTQSKNTLLDAIVSLAPTSGIVYYVYCVYCVYCKLYIVYCVYCTIRLLRITWKEAALNWR